MPSKLSSMHLILRGRNPDGLATAVDTGRGYATLSPIAERAKSRGEKDPADFDIAEGILAPIYFRRYVTARPIDEAFIQRIVMDTLRRSPSSEPGAPSGLTSATKVGIPTR